MRKLIAVLAVLFVCVGWGIVLPGQCASDDTLNTNKKLQAYQQEQDKLFADCEAKMAKAVEDGAPFEELVEPVNLQYALTTMEELTVRLGGLCSAKLTGKCLEMTRAHREKLDQLFKQYVEPHKDFPHISPNYQEQITSLIKANMVDPDSLKIEFTDIKSKQYRNVQTGSPFVGWSVIGNFNAKNRMGGYNGFQPFMCFVNEKDVVSCLVGDSIIKK